MNQQRTYVFNVEALVKRKFKNVSISAESEEAALEKIRDLIKKTNEDAEIVSMSCRTRTRSSRLSLKAKIEKLKRAGYQYIGDDLDEKRMNSLWYDEGNMPNVVFTDENRNVRKVTVKGPVTVNIMDGDNIIAGYNGAAGGTLEEALGEYIQCDGDIRKGLRKKNISIINTNWFQVEGTDCWSYDLKDMFEVRSMKKIFD